MLFVLQLADAFDTAGVLIYSRLLLVPQLFLFSIATAYNEITVAASIAAATDYAVC
jgi:hypothetical protein